MRERGLGFQGEFQGGESEPTPVCCLGQEAPLLRRAQQQDLAPKDAQRASLHPLGRRRIPTDAPSRQRQALPKKPVACPEPHRAADAPAQSGHQVTRRRKPAGPRLPPRQRQQWALCEGAVGQGRLGRRRKRRRHWRQGRLPRQSRERPSRCAVSARIAAANAGRSSGGTGKSLPSASVTSAAVTMRSTAATAAGSLLPAEEVARLETMAWRTAWRRRSTALRSAAAAPKRRSCCSRGKSAPAARDRNSSSIREPIRWQLACSGVRDETGRVDSPGEEVVVAAVVVVEDVVVVEAASPSEVEGETEGCDNRSSDSSEESSSPRSSSISSSGCGPRSHRSDASP